MNKLGKLLVTSLMVFALAGCTSTSESSLPSSSEGEHVHRYDLENVEWFWKQLQNKDYEARATFTCLDCKDDLEGHSVIVEADVNKEETRHATCSQDGLYTYTATVTFQGHEFSDTKTREFTDASAHHYVNVVDAQYLVSAANCEDDAVYYKSCEYCHEASEETFVDVGSKLGHDLVHHDAKGSTCQEHGNLEYYQCSRCQKYFLEEDGEPVGYNQIELPLSHHMTYHPGTAATCTADGYLGYYTCEFEPGVKYFDEAGERIVESDEDLFVHALGHEYDENGNCVRGDTTLQEQYTLEEPSLLDTLAPSTLSDAGIADGAVPIHTAGHIFGTYDFLGKKGIDLWLKFKYTEVVSGDTQLAIYLFNERDESGVVFRFDTNRTENDGILVGYILDKVNNVNTQLIFPISANIKSGEVVTAHIFAYLIDSATNKFTVGYQAGVNALYNPVDYPPGTGYETNSPLYTKDITLGANYFNNGVHRTLRISGIRNSSISINSIKPTEKKVVLQNENGDIYGVKRYDADTELSLPVLYKENYQFLGWFDSLGSKYSSIVVNSTYYLTARFIAKQEAMFVPSDAGFATKDAWKSITSESANEEYYSLPVSSTSTRNDIYFILDAVSREGNDPFVVFGFPYDATDALTRVFLRINYNKDLNHLSGYFYGHPDSSLGPAEKAGNLFQDSSVLISNYKLLVHLYVTSTVIGGLTFTAGAEIINLGTGDSFSIESPITTAVNFSTADASRNMFCLQRVSNAVGSEFRVTDAF